MKKTFLLFVAICCSLSAYAQKESPRDKAQKYFDNALYAKALPMLLAYAQQKPKDWDTKYLIGVCYFQIGQAARAQQFLEDLTKETGKKPPAQTYFYLAKAHHYQQHYEEAVKNYKLALAEISSSDPLRQLLKNDIQRCLKGSKMQYAEQLAYVDNLGDIINTNDDEFAPVVATNAKNEDVLLFSATRPENLGFAYDATGKESSEYGKMQADIFLTEQVSGEWRKPDHLDEPYSSILNDQILDLSEDGVFVYLAKPDKKDRSAIFYAPYFETDSINGGAQDPAKLMPEPINSPSWDGDSYFFRDSILLFSSEREGGYGGKDLYISQRNDMGKWTDPVNLGPVVNTAFDETSPFLAKDGRTLYFSANNLQSIGGLDVFRTFFVDSAKAFTAPENLGLPINSPADDQYFRITKDGNRAYFSSDRMGGKGMRDLYVAYFKTAVAEQKKVNNPASFVETLSPLLRSQGSNSKPIIRETAAVIPTDNEKPQSQQLKISPIFYNETVMPLVPTTAAELNSLAAAAARYPKLKFEFIAHADDDGIRNFSLYFSAKRLEEIATYLIQKGVTPDRLLLKSVGMSYPIASNRTPEGQPNEVGRTLNRRVEIRVLNAEQTPLQIEDVRPVMSEQLRVETGDKFRASLGKITYKVQIKAAKTMYDDPLLANAADAMIETTSGTGMFRYTVGLFQQYAPAEQLRLLMIEKGLRDSFVVAYLNGQRISQEQLPELINMYPDLKNLIKE